MSNQLIKRHRFSSFSQIIPDLPKEYPKKVNFRVFIEDDDDNDGDEEELKSRILCCRCCFQYRELRED